MTQENETKIIRKMFEILANHGWHAVEVFDGEEDVETTNHDEILETVFAVELSGIRFIKGDRMHTVTLIPGNGNAGWDVISDYSYSETDDFDTAMQEVAAWIEQEEMRR
jgi:hypothetical protein